MLVFNNWCEGLDFMAVFDKILGVHKLLAGSARVYL